MKNSELTRRLRTLAFMSAFVLVVVGCVSVPQAIRAPSKSWSDILREDQALQCCIALRDVVISPTPTTSSVNRSFGESQVKLGLSAGASGYFAFAVPRQSGSTYFNIKSYVVDSPSGVYAVEPIVRVLNDDFSISRQSSVEMFNFRRPNPIHAIPGVFNLYVRINHLTHPRERYVVVTTNAEPIGKYFDVKEIGGSESSGYIRSSPQGIVEIIPITSILNRPFDRAVFF
jgi:Maltose operon periplasmic protein precursor (MalM)